MRDAAGQSTIADVSLVRRVVARTPNGDRWNGADRGAGQAPALFTQDTPATGCWLIHRGRVVIETLMPGRGPVPIETLGPNELVGWSWFVPPYRWQFSAVALTEVTATELDTDLMRRLTARSAAQRWQDRLQRLCRRYPDPGIHHRAAIGIDDQRMRSSSTTSGSSWASKPTRVGKSRTAPASNTVVAGGPNRLARTATRAGDPRRPRRPAVPGGRSGRRSRRCPHHRDRTRPPARTRRRSGPMRAGRRETSMRMPIAHATSSTPTPTNMTTWSTPVIPRHLLKNRPAFMIANG